MPNLPHTRTKPQKNPALSDAEAPDSAGKVVDPFWGPFSCRGASPHLGTVWRGLELWWLGSMALPLLEANWECGHIPGGGGEPFDSIQ